jgi:SAM-dependent methyltransferase
MKARYLIRGLATWRPGWTPHEPTGGTDSARYCYGVWMRHLIRARDGGALGDPPAVPRVVAELGPGDSLGIGLAALLSGVDRYDAFDVVRHARPERNLEVFEGLVELFRRREAVPDHRELPAVVPTLDDYAFPADLLGPERLAAALAPDRLHEIREAILRPERRGSALAYRVPWNDASVLDPGSVDFVFSQAVLEHVEDLPGTHAAVHAWLRPGGIASHTIDYRCHRFSDDWNGHWTYSDLAWRIVKGRRPYLLNREPHSVHVRRVVEAGFRILDVTAVRSASRVPRERLARRFRSLGDDDLTTASAFLLTVKPA